MVNRGVMNRSGRRSVALMFLGLLCLGSPCISLGQTPSPLQEWQYPGGIILSGLFEPQLPKWRRVLGLAASVEPAYDGAVVYRGEVGPALDVRYRNIAFVSVGEGIGVNVIHARHVNAGIALGYDLGRTSSSDYRHLRGLDDLNPAPVPKLFVSWALSRSFPLVLRADIRRLMRRGDGFVGDLEAYMPLPGSSRRLVMFAGPSYTFADRRHMQETFGITPAQARSSGYSVYAARGGSNTEGIGFSATLFITQHWLLNLDAAVDRLLGSAAASPLSRRPTQRTLDIATAYQW